MVMPIPEKLHHNYSNFMSSEQKKNRIFSGPKNIVANLVNCIPVPHFLVFLRTDLHKRPTDFDIIILRLIYLSMI